MLGALSRGNYRLRPRPNLGVVVVSPGLLRVRSDWSSPQGSHRVGTSGVQVSFLINGLTDTGLRGPQRHLLQSVSPAAESLLQANARGMVRWGYRTAPRCLSDPFLPVAVPLDPLRWLEMSIVD